MQVPQHHSQPVRSEDGNGQGIRRSTAKASIEEGWKSIKVAAVGTLGESITRGSLVQHPPILYSRRPEAKRSYVPTKLFLPTEKELRYLRKSSFPHEILRPGNQVLGRNQHLRYEKTLRKLSGGKYDYWPVWWDAQASLGYPEPIPLAGKRGRYKHPFEDSRSL